MERGADLPEEFKFTLDEESFIPTEREKKMARLFRAYLSALAENAYDKEAPQQLNHAEENALPWIHAICRNTQKGSSDFALRVWVLFTANKKKLATGRLKQYKFRTVPMKAKDDRADTRPENLDENQSRKIRCDIILFDHLLDLLQPPDREYAKFQFYARSRFDRFTHYKTSIEKLYEFNCAEEAMDGVDQLGCLIRYHIEHCLMDTPVWLTRARPNYSPKPLLNSLTDLLLHDATLLPVKRRMTERMRRVIEDAKGKEAVAQYRSKRGNEDGITKLITQLREEQNLHFQKTHVFMDEEPLRDPNLNQCERCVIEYFLKKETFKPLYANLLKKAESLFPAKWFLSKRVFGG